VALPVGRRFYVSRGSVSDRDVVALSAPDYVSTSRDDDLWGEAASGGGGEASA
jgi:hypothetical protein